jgi:hypothetical protein
MQPNLAFPRVFLLTADARRPRAEVFTGPKLLRLLEREGFRYATSDGGTAFSGKRLEIAYLRW